MTSILQLVFFLRMLATGLFMPVMALLLMAHGAAIETISLLVGTFSVTAVAAEFPSGVLADLFGQKRVFLLSALFSVVSYSLMLVSHSVWVLLGAMVSMGLSRACASGTLDALAVNQEQAHDEASLLRITTRFSVLESAGLAAGALLGGLLAGIGDRYLANIAVSIGLYGLVFMLALLGIHEHRPPVRPGEGQPVRTVIGNQMKQSLAFLGRKGVVRTLLVLSAATGFALVTVETYWQPAYAAFAAPAWTLGLISFGGYLFVMLGSRLIARILRRHTQHVQAAFLWQRAMVGVAMAALYFAGSAVPFIGIYLLSYLFLGGSSVVESTLIHRAADDAQRSSIVSLFSFVLQIGGALASVLGFFISAQLDFRLMWPLTGAVLLLCVLLRIPGKQRNRQRI